MRLKRNFAKQIDQANSEIQILNMSVRDDIEKEADELQEIEAILQILREELHYLYLMLFDVGQYGVDIELLEEKGSALIL